MSLKFGEAYWLQQAKKSDNMHVRVVANILLDQLASDCDISKWRSWTVAQCKDYLAKLAVDPDGDDCRLLNVQGYNSRLILYRVLQAVGYISPPPGSEYHNYPEALRSISHQTRDLCFWPVPVGKYRIPMLHINCLLLNILLQNL